MGIGAYRHRVTLQGPSQGPIGLEPEAWFCSIQSSASQVVEGQTAYFVRGRFHSQISLETQIEFEGRTLQVQAIEDIAEQHQELLLMCVEVVGRGRPAPAVVPLPPAYVDVIIADGAVAYWPLGDPFGSLEARELVGGNHAAITGGAVQVDRPGVGGGRCMTFEASGWLETAEALAIGPIVSFEFWIKAPAQGATFVLALDEVAQTGATTIRNDGAIQAFLFSVSDRPNSPLVCIGSVCDDVWHHCVFVSTFNSIFFYRDGVQDSSNYISMVAFSSRLAIGASWSDADWVLRGSIQDVAIYDRILLPAEIAAHFSLRAAA